MKVGIKKSTSTRNYQNKAVDRHTFNRKRVDPSNPVLSTRCQGAPWEHKHCAKLDCACPCHGDQI